MESKRSKGDNKVSNALRKTPDTLTPKKKNKRKKGKKKKIENV